MRRHTHNIPGQLHVADVLATTLRARSDVPALTMTTTAVKVARIVAVMAARMSQHFQYLGQRVLVVVGDASVINHVHFRGGSQIRHPQAL